MSTIEIIVLSSIGACVLFSLYYIFFHRKKKTKDKKSKNKDDKKLGEKKVEKAIKTGKEEVKETQKEEVKEEPKKEPFKIIRKQSTVKINKKALKSGSRNPSITKVFDKGRRIDQPEEIKNEDLFDTHDAEKEFTLEKQLPTVGAFGVREPEINTESTKQEFKIKAPFGSPNRAPTIGDRTNFGSHLNVSEDGNLSGILGTGVAKAIVDANRVADKADDKTELMIQDVRRNILGIKSDIGAFDYLNLEGLKNQPKTKAKLKNIDAETLIIADAIVNPKYKKKK